jgi:glycosyltransferase involved in cell wall biosynthesis
MSRDKRIVIGTIAAVDVKYKGQENVIKDLGHLKNEGILNFEYHLVGGGDQIHLSELAKKYNVHESIKFIGSLPHNKIFEWLDSIDIYIQPSLTEGLPRALIEAMSRGTPSIGTVIVMQAEFQNCYILHKYGANDVPVGLTGWAQINGRDELEIEEKAKFDGEYVKKIGFLMDARCFFGTLIIVFRSKGVI